MAKRGVTSMIKREVAGSSPAWSPLGSSSSVGRALATPLACSSIVPFL